MNLRVVFPGGRIYTLRGDRTDLSIGFRVHCSVGKRKLTGIVVGFSDQNPEGEVLEVPDSRPLILEPQIEAIKELSFDYLRTWSSLIFNLLPAGFFPRWVERVYVSGKIPRFTDPLTAEILSYVKKRGGVPIDLLKKRYTARTIHLLLKKGFLEVREGWKSYPEAKEKRFRLAIPLKKALERVRSHKKRRILVLLSGKKSVSVDDLQGWGIRPSDLKDLIKRGLVEEYEEREEQLSEGIQPLREVDEDVSFIEGRFEDCIRYILALARTGRSRNQNTLVLFALTSQLLRAQEMLSHSEDAIVIHSGSGYSKLLHDWLSVYDRPLTVMGTYSSCLVPLDSAFAVVVVDESSKGVRIRQAGDVDLRRLAYILSRKLSAKFVIVGPAPSVSGFYLLLSKGGKEKNLTSGEPRVRVTERLPSEILTQELVEFFAEGDKGKTLFLVSREGYSYLFCPRCQTICLCPECGSYMTYSKQRERFYCSSCGYKHGDLSCPDCEGDLEDTGFGIERAIEVVENAIGLRDEFSFDTFPRWESEYDTVAVLSADSILSVPSYRSSEEFFLYLMRAKRVARRQLLIQTVFPNIREIQALRDPDPYYREELSTRKKERLPPFWRLVKITTTKEDLPAYLSKVVTPHLQSYRNLRKGTTEILLRIQDRASLKRLDEVRRRFSRDIIELRVDPQV